MKSGRYTDKIKFLARLAGSVLLLGWLLSRTGVSSLFHAFRQIPPSAWGAAISLYAASQFISSFRWQGIATSLGFSGGYLRYLKLYFTGMFFNLFMPTSIGGDLFKAVFLAGEGNEGGKVWAGYSIFIDRLLGMAGLFVLGSATVTLYPGLLPPGLSLALAGVTAAGICGLCMIRTAGRLMIRFFPSIEGRINAIMKIWHHPAVVLKAAALSVPVQFLSISALAVMGDAMRIDVEPAYYFAIFPAVALLSILPVSISGLGIREGTLACFLALKGVPEEQAVALGLGLFSVQAVVSLAGGPVYITGSYKTGGCQKQ